MIECQICHEEFKEITHLHLKTHNFTLKQYKLQFPNKILISIESRNRRSESGKKKIFTEEHKKNISIAKILHPTRLIGKDNPCYGRKYPLEHRLKLSIIHQKQKYKHTQEAKDKISKFSKEKVKLGIVPIGKSGNEAPNWQGGISKFPYCEKWNNKLREEIRDKYNRKCYICGKAEKDNITINKKYWKLSVHHIDRDKEQGCNGKSWRLVPLCRSCHGKAHKINFKIEGEMK